MKRAQRAHLIHGPELKNVPNLSAIEEFLVHGLKYAFPAERGGMTRGTPTAYAAEPLRHRIAPGDEPVPVWPSPNGTQRGLAFEPLHRNAPDAAAKDPVFHEYLALADALRSGRARERKYAEQELKGRLEKAHAGLQ